MSEFATIETAAVLPPVLPDWPSRMLAVTADLIEMGMHKDYAEDGAWWLVLAECMRAEDCDAYDAEVTLRRAGVLPADRGLQRWTRTRGGDYLVPGTSGPLPLKYVEEPRPPKGRTGPEFMAKHRRSDLDKVLWAWRDFHGFMEVKVCDVHEKVRAELGGGRAGEWSDDDIARALDRLVGSQLSDGRQFYAIGRRGWGYLADTYQLRFPEAQLRGPLKDPTFRPWLDRITEHTLRLRDDPSYMTGEPLSLRMACADRVAFNEAVEAYAIEIGEGQAQVRRRFEAAGLGN